MARLFERFGLWLARSHVAYLQSQIDKLRTEAYEARREVERQASGGIGSALWMERQNKAQFGVDGRGQPSMKKQTPLRP